MKKTKFKVGDLIIEKFYGLIRFVYKVTGDRYYLLRINGICSGQIVSFTKNYVYLHYKEIKQNDDS